jgi:Protein of unknown function (DUF2891)
MKLCIRGLAAALAVSLSAMAAMSQGGASETERELAALDERKAEVAAELAATVRQCVARKDTGYAAFHGCIDWHSAVHGTWALIAYARITGDKRDAALIANAMAPVKIAAERQLLRTQPVFEMPYGRAWFLRLAREHALAGGDGVLTPMAEDVLTSMLDYYRRQPPDPRRGSYGSDSWALINMHEYATFTGNASALRTIHAAVNGHFVRHAAGCDYALETGEFMGVCTNWAWLVSKVLAGDAFEVWAEGFFKSSGLPRPVTKPVNWHHHGLNFSRAWGLWQLYAASGSASTKEAYLAAYLAHFREAYDRPALWGGSYEGVGHWVPQFGMLALQPLFGHGRHQPRSP